MVYDSNMVLNYICDCVVNFYIVPKHGLCGQILNAMTYQRPQNPSHNCGFKSQFKTRVLNHSQVQITATALLMDLWLIALQQLAYTLIKQQGCIVV